VEEERSVQIKQHSHKFLDFKKYNQRNSRNKDFKNFAFVAKPKTSQQKTNSDITEKFFFVSFFSFNKFYRLLVFSILI
jgi:hypothetical protein